MNLSSQCINLVKRFEGCVLHSYQDIAGVWTIGYGHTGRDVKKNQTITQSRANYLLHQDLAYFERGVTNCVKVKLNQNQFDALVSFAYNVGLGALHTSTLLEKLNKGDYSGASKEFDRWIHAGGRVVRGLQNRRDAEQALFNTPTKDPSPAVKKAVEDKAIVPYPNKLIHRGSTGKDVERIQRAVKVYPDGIFGQVTERTVKAYQKRHGLSVDGIVGRETWNMMF